MNCDQVRQRLLSKTDPGRLTKELASHMNSCPGCKSWHQALMTIQAAAVALPIPGDESPAKKKFIDQFLAAPSPTAPVVLADAKPSKQPSTPKSPKLSDSKNAVIKPSEKVARLPGAKTPLGERLAKLWPAGIAASVIGLGVIAYTNFSSKGTTEVAAAPADPMLERIVKAKVDVDVATTTAERLKAMNELAKEIQDEAKALSLVANNGEIGSLSRMYSQVVRDGMLALMEQMTPQERKQLLRPYIDRLSESEQELNRLSVESLSGSQQSFKEMAQAAQATRETFAKLTREQT